MPDHVRAELEVYEPDLTIKEMCEQSKVPLLSFLFGPNLRRLGKDYRNRKGKRDYRKNRQTNFEVARFYLLLISSEIKSDAFRNEYTSLSDIYNAIGATRMALILSFMFYVTYNVLSPIHRGELSALYMYPALINGTIFTFAIFIIQSRRTRTGAACQSMLSNTVNWYVKRIESTAATSDGVTL